MKKTVNRKKEKIRILWLHRPQPAHQEISFKLLNLALNAFTC